MTNDLHTDQERRRLGLILLLTGLVTWLALMGYIVYIRTPHVMILVLTACCWGVSMVGKTMLKTKDPVPEARQK
jgi:hypothetical protein